MEGRGKKSRTKRTRTKGGKKSRRRLRKHTTLKGGIGGVDAATTAMDEGGFKEAVEGFRADEHQRKRERADAEAAAEAKRAYEAEARRRADEAEARRRADAEPRDVDFFKDAKWVRDRGRVDEHGGRYGQVQFGPNEIEAALAAMREEQFLRDAEKARAARQDRRDADLKKQQAAMDEFDALFFRPRGLAGGGSGGKKSRRRLRKRTTLKGGKRKRRRTRRRR